MPNFEDYLEYFFQKSHKSVQTGKEQELFDNLGHATELIRYLVDENAKYGNEIESNYAYSKRQFANLYEEAIKTGADTIIRRRILNSISVTTRYAAEASDTEAFNALLGSLIHCYVQSYPDTGFDDSVEHILEQIGKIQYHVGGLFEDSEDSNELYNTIILNQIFLEKCRTLWRIAVENECEESIKHLHNILTDLRVFEKHKYAPWRYESNEFDEDFINEKQKVADSFRKEIRTQKFATYAWAYHLYTQDEFNGNEFIEYILRDYAERGFSSFDSLSNVYFEIQSDTPHYWEDWDIDRKLQNSIGAVRTAVGSNYSDSDFYLAFALYLLSEESQQKLTNSEPEEFPFPKDRFEHKNLRNKVESFKDEYPLDFLFDDKSMIDHRADILYDIFDQAHSYSKRQEIVHVRNQPLDSNIIQNWENKLNEKFDSSVPLRKALFAANILKQKRFPPKNLDGIKVFEGSHERRVFVDQEGVHNTVTSNFNSVFEEYVDYVLRRLNTEDYKVNDVEDLLNEMEKEVRQKDVAVILLHLGDHRIELLDDSRFSREDTEVQDAHYTFLDVPVLTEYTGRFKSLLLFESDSHGVEFVECSTADGRKVEFDEDCTALKLSVIPYEQVDGVELPNKSLESIPYGQAPQDRVKIDIRLRGYIKSEGLDGIKFNID